MFIISIFIIQSIFWDISSYISDDGKSWCIQRRQHCDWFKLQSWRLCLLVSPYSVIASKPQGSLNQTRSPSCRVHFPCGVTRQLNPIRHVILSVAQSSVLCLSSSFLVVIHHRRELHSSLVPPLTGTKSSRVTMAYFGVFARLVLQLLDNKIVNWCKIIVHVDNKIVMYMI